MKTFLTIITIFVLIVIFSLAFLFRQLYLKRDKDIYKRVSSTLFVSTGCGVVLLLVILFT